MIASAVFFTILFSSCNNATDNAKTNSDIDTMPVNQNDVVQTAHPEINLDSMKNLVRNFNSHFNRKDTIITKFHRTQLIKMLELMTVDTVKFVVGAIRPDDPESSRRRKAVICLKTLSTDKTTTVYYMGNLCPPPHGCNMEN